MNIRPKRTLFIFALLLVTISGVSLSRNAHTDNLNIKAPAIVSDTWLNTGAVQWSDLRGKVVLVEFWTFGCRNCRNVEPYIKAWYQQFHSSGLEIISVHSPEFDYEKNVENVRQYVVREGLEYPVAIDNGFSNWERYDNRFWPTLYLIDKAGYIRHIKIGEGGYKGTELRIQALLNEVS